MGSSLLLLQRLLLLHLVHMPSDVVVLARIILRHEPADDHAEASEGEAGEEDL